MVDFQVARSRAFTSDPMNFQARVAMLGNLRGSAARASKKQLSLNGDTSRQYLDLVDLELEDLAKEEGQAPRALVMGIDFLLARKESTTGWLSELDSDDQNTKLAVHELIRDFDLSDAITYPPDPPPLRLPAAGLNLTNRLLPTPRPARS